MPCLRVSLLGPFSSRLDERSLNDFESDKVRALLAYLAVEAGRPHRRSALAGLLWQDFQENAARASLRNALSNLRLVIQDNLSNPRYLICDRETIQFNLASNHWIDMRAFEDKIAVGRGEKAAPNIESRMKHLKEAVELYQGSFLQGFSLRDSPGFEEWQLLKQEGLLHHVLTALSILVEYYEKNGDHLLACEYAQRQVSLAPWQEEAHRCLMRLFAKSGQRSQALAQYEFCRHKLNEDLGVQPERETILLYEQIRENLFGEVTRVGTSRWHNLPAEVSPLVGRNTELVEIEQLLADRSCRLLALIGPGGSGKTRLALEVARHQIERFPDGVYIVPLEPFQSVDAVTSAIAHVLGFTFLQADNSRSMLLDNLRQKKLLLILDSFEHVPEAAALVVDILWNAGGVKILATSRERLNLQDEHIIPLVGLVYPREKALDADLAICFDAVQLFLECAQRLEPAYRFTDKDIEAAVAICQQVQGMPLAILLAASWCTTLPVPQIAFELHKHSLDFLVSEWHDLPERQRSMRAVFEYSYNLLKEYEQKVFEKLGVFPGSFSYQAATSVTQAEPIQLMRLVDKTMLQRLEGGRFELHDLLRQFAVRKLALRPEVEHPLRARHIQFYTSALNDLAIDLQGSRQAETVRALLPDFPNIQTAWNWAVEDRRLDNLDLALDGLCGMYQWYGRFSEGATACQRAADSLTTGLPGELGEVETCLLIRLLAWQVYFANILGQISGLKRNLGLAFQLAAKLDLTKETSLSTRAFLLQQAGLYYIEKDFPAGWACLLESLALYRKLEWRWWEAQVLEYLGWFAPHQDAFKTSRAWLEESLAIRRALGDHKGVASALYCLSNEAGQEGDFERMGILTQESLEYSRMLGTRASQADIQLMMASRLCYLGKFSEALIAITESSKQFKQLENKDRLSLALSVKGWIETNLGDYNQGRIDTETSLEIAISTKNLSLQAVDLFGLGEIQTVEELYDQALKSLQESMRLYRQMPQRDEMGMTLTRIAAIEARLGLYKQASLDFQEGKLICTQAGSWQAKVYVLANLALIIAEQGEIERAIEYYALATRHPYLGNSRYWWDIAGKRLQELSDRVSNEVVEAAKQRGILRDLDETFDGISIALVS